MRICILTHTFPRHKTDFAAPFMDGVATGQTLAGNEVFVLTPFVSNFKRKKSDQIYKIRTYKYIWPDSLHKLGYSQTLSNDMSVRPIMYFLSPFMHFFGLLALLRLIREEKIDIINAHWILPNGFIAAMATKLTGVPSVSTLPGSDVYMAEKNSVFSWMARFATKTNSWVTSNSPQLLADLARINEKSKRKQQDLMKNKFSPIIYGTYPDKFKPSSKFTKQIKRELKIAHDQLVVLGVGRLVAKKGFRYLIEAAPSVLRANKNVVFVVIGEGDQRKELEDLAKRLNIWDKFRFPGWAEYDKLVHYYNFCDVFILPSVRDEEGNLDDQSVSVVEAMSCAKPIVTSDFPGYRIVIEHGKNGFLVKEKDSNGISKALSKLVTDKKLRDKMGRRSRELILQKFSWPAIGETYTRLFGKLTTKSYSQSILKILKKDDRLKKAKQICTILEDYLKSTKKMRCLDIGCSSGVITNHLANDFKEVVGIDIDIEAISKAKKSFNKKNLRFEQMSGDELKFRANSFDVVIANQLYEFVDNPEKVFSEINRVLKKGGVCFMSARNKWALIEAQYNLPFLSMMPRSLASLIIRLVGKGNTFLGDYKGLQELKKLVSKFREHDYTLKVLKNPSRYNFTDLQKYELLLKYFPFETIYPLIPNYIWLLEKK